MFEFSHSFVSNLAKEIEHLLISFAGNPTLARKGISESQCTTANEFCVLQKQVPI